MSRALVCAPRVLMISSAERDRQLRRLLQAERREQPVVRLQRLDVGPDAALARQRRRRCSGRQSLPHRPSSCSLSFYRLTSSMRRGCARDVVGRHHANFTHLNVDQVWLRQLLRRREVYRSECGLHRSARRPLHAAEPDGGEGVCIVR